MQCPNHNSRLYLASESIGLCGACIADSSTIGSKADDTHRQSRLDCNLPITPPKGGDIICPDCGNHCGLVEGEYGYCTLTKAENSKLIRVYGSKTPVSCYFDTIPTNCVAEWICPVAEKFGKNSIGRKNLAVFYGSCNSDCLFCQNISYREMMQKGKPLLSPKELAAFSDDRTACVCYFGGDPACNREHSLCTSSIINSIRETVICYESNGNFSKKWLDRIADVVEATKGTFKFDLKAITPSLYSALTGISNKAVLSNFEKLAERGSNRENEFLVASILLIPGYIDLTEVRKLCRFIADNDSTIPTALLGFFPRNHMSDLPRTSKAHALAALAVAEEEGLTNVRIGNTGLMSDTEYIYE